MKSPGDLQCMGQQAVVLCFRVSTFKHVSCPAEHTKSWKKKHSVHLLTVVRLFLFSCSKYHVHKYFEMFASFILSHACTDREPCTLKPAVTGTISRAT